MDNKNDPKPPRDIGLADLNRGFKVVIAQALEYKSLFIVSLILTYTSGLISPVLPYIFGKLIDLLRVNIPISGGVINNSDFIYTAIGLLAAYSGINILQAFVDRAKGLRRWRLGEYARTSYMIKISNHIMRLPISFHKQTKVGEYQEKISSAAGGVRDILSLHFINTTQQFLSLIISLVVIGFINMGIFWLLLVAVIFFTWISFRTFPPLFKLHKESQRNYVAARGHVTDAIANIRTVKDFSSEEYEEKEATRLYQEKAVPFWLKYFRLRRNASTWQEVITDATQALIFAFSIYLIQKGSMTLGQLVMINAYVLATFSPLKDLSENWRDIQNGIINIEEVENIMDSPVENYSPKGASSQAISRGEVRFEDVSFHYQKESPVLSEISFEAKPGQITAMVGESGVGKSSLIDLISGYHFPEKGQIFIDGAEIRTIPLKTLRHAIGFVTQEVTLFNMTVIENIRYGNFEKTDAEVMDAAHRAHCDQFIEKFPEKYQQKVGERGLKLSVGQKQRIAIARAILKNPKILILDEPTSALDAGSEKIITESLEQLMQGKTTFIVAHRLSTVRKADQILVFKDGRIIERGRHDELIKIDGGEYRRLYELQIGLSE